MAGIDLHAHTNRSDGTFTPTELVRLAVELGVEVVPGVEFSAEYQGVSVHVLCYWMDPSNEELRAELRRLLDSRFRRGELMIDKLRALGYPISFEQVRRIAGGGNIVRPHVAQAMVEAGIVATEQEAFDRFIADGGPAHVPKHALDPVDAVGLIRQ